MTKNFALFTNLCQDKGKTTLKDISILNGQRVTYFYEN